MKSYYTNVAISVAMASQFTPQLLYLYVMAVGDGPERYIPFLIFQVTSLSGLLVWIYVASRIGAKQTFRLASFTLALGLGILLIPRDSAVEVSAFFVGTGSMGVGALMTTVLTRLQETAPRLPRKSPLPLIIALLTWSAVFVFVLLIDFHLAVLIFLAGLLLPYTLVEKFNIDATGSWKFARKSFLYTFLVTVLFTASSRSLSLIKGTDGFFEVLALVLVLLAYVLWTMFNRSLRRDFVGLLDRRMQFISFNVGMFGGWLLIGAVFLVIALYDIDVLVTFVFVPFVVGALIWSLVQRTFGMDKNPFAIMILCSLPLFFALFTPLWLPIALFIGGYVQSMYASTTHAALYVYYQNEKELAALVQQFFRRIGLFVIQSFLMIGLILYELGGGGGDAGELRTAVFRLLSISWVIWVGLSFTYMIVYLGHVKNGNDQ